MEGLTREIMTLQAEGNYEKAKPSCLIRVRSSRKWNERSNKMGGVPVDIEPKFTTAEQLVRENP